MVVNISDVANCINNLTNAIESISEIEDKNLYVFGGCGLVMYGVCDERDTHDIDLFYPDAQLLPIYSGEFHNGGYAGIVRDYPSSYQLEQAEIFRLIENEPLEDYIMENSLEIKKQGDTTIFLAPLEALTVNKVSSYGNSPARDKDYADVMDILRCKKGDSGFKIKLDKLLNKCGLTEKYNNHFCD